MPSRASGDLISLKKNKENKIFYVRLPPISFFWRSFRFPCPSFLVQFPFRGSNLGHVIYTAFNFVTVYTYAVNFFLLKLSWLSSPSAAFFTLPPMSKVRLRFTTRPHGTEAQNTWRFSKCKVAPKGSHLREKWPHRRAMWQNEPVFT